MDVVCIMENIKKAFIRYKKDNNVINTLLLQDLITKIKIKKGLRLLDKILESNPHISIIDLNEEIFTNPKYLEVYSLEFMASNIEKIPLNYLKYGINDLEYDEVSKVYKSIIRDRIITIIEHDIPIDNISPFLLTYDDLPNNFFIDNKNVFINYTVSKYFKDHFSFRNSEDIEYIKLVGSNVKALKCIEFLIINFQNINLKQYIHLTKNDIDFLDKMINLIIESQVVIDIEYDEFMDFYYNNKKLIEGIDVNSKELLSNFKKYFSNKVIKIKNIQDLLNINQQSYKIIMKKFDEENCQNIKNSIANIYFNYDYDYVSFLICKINNLKENLDIIFTDDEIKNIKLLNNFIDSENQDELKKIFELIHKCEDVNNLVSNIEKKYNSYCKKTICNNLYKTKNKPKIIEFSGQEFNILIHKIKGHGLRGFANKLIDNPSLWFSKWIFGSYISTSLISDLFLGVDEGLGCIFGFVNIKIDDIIDMGTEDIFSSINLYKSKRKNPKSNYYPLKRFIQKTSMLYNEIVIRRFRNKKAIMPDCIVCFDDITNTDIKMANYFDIPIYLIHTEKYIEKMNDNLTNLLNNYQFTEYYDYRNNKLYSMYDNNELLTKEFSIDNLNKEMSLLIEKMNEYIEKHNDKNTIKECISILKRISNKNVNKIIPKLNINSSKYNFKGENIDKYLKFTR